MTNDNQNRRVQAGLEAVRRMPAARPEASHYVGGIDHATGAGAVYRVDVDGESEPLNPRLDLRNHSPTGLQWGYGGSGPAQLALAILADHLGDEEAAQQYYQPFKWAVIARLEQGEPWTLTAEQIDAALGEIAARGGA